jgi:hypothetical protein
MSAGGLPHLFERLARLELRIRDAVETRRAADPNPADPFRGLYLSNEAIDALLEAHREPFAPFTETAPDGRLGRLAGVLKLTGVDVELLLVALAPDVGSRFEQFYGYLNDDVTRRRATVGLALRLCGIAEASASGRARLDADRFRDARGRRGRSPVPVPFAAGARPGGEPPARGRPARPRTRRIRAAG